MKNSVTITANGNEIVVFYEHEEKMVDKISYADGWNIPLGKEIFKLSKLTFLLDGKNYLISQHAIDNYTNKRIVDACAKLNTSTYYTGEGMTFILSKKNVDTINALIAETSAAAADPEVRREEEKEALKKEQAKRAEAEKIIADAEKSPKNKDGSLMTKEEARRWRARWNNIHNEGGEGFVPDVITVEMLEYAKKVLEK